MADNIFAKAFRFVNSVGKAVLGQMRSSRLGNDANTARDAVKDELSELVPGYGIVRNVMDRLTGEHERYNNRLAEDMAISDWERSETSARNAFAREKEMWQMNTDYNTQMSNTAYQRAMADMEAAGLNPILAYQQGGASTPVMASATAPQGSSSKASPDRGDSLSAILQFAANTARSVASVASSALRPATVVNKTFNYRR